MYQTLYRKYRPQNFDQVVGQKHIVNTLKGQIESGKFSHAYLFCGTRGTGKTTCARILAKAISCTSLSDGNPCNECESCRIVNSGNSVDIIEIDAASNNGVENIRSLIEEVRYTPVELKKRVYIIDEVHMLTIQAFNALLKTLEEPPEHVVFILATTEIHKIPATIMSRCQRFDFKRIGVEEITESLMAVAAKEGISIERDAAKIVAKMSDGAMRNAYSMLESCIGCGEIVTAEMMINRLGTSNREELINLIGFISYSNSAGALRIVSEMYEAQNDFANILNELLRIYRDLLILKSAPSCEQFLECYDKELPQLKKICEKITYSNMCKQADKIRILFENADKYGNTIRAAFEIAIIEMCEKEICIDIPAAHEQEQRVKSDAWQKKEQKAPAKKETQPDKHTLDNSITEENKQPIEQKTDISSSYLKFGILREEIAKRSPETFPFFENVKAECRDGRLFIVCSDMLVKMILSNNTNLPLIKGIVGSISPEIQEVIVTDKVVLPQEEEF
ncbi:MAG: DNA polymerase III subunit gamma/tau [Clostridia bacterium]|nr:DNA polymerase III subunit gamma/tau [Clostridia bacterium]